MSTTTTYGYKKPANGDRGTWWTDLTYNIDRMDTHSHDGVNSAKVGTASLTKHVQAIPTATWVLISNGNYYKNVAMPTGFLFSTGVSIKFYVDGGSEDGAEVILTVEKNTNSNFKIYSNDNTLALKAVYA